MIAFIRGTRGAVSAIQGRRAGASAATLLIATLLIATLLIAGLRTFVIGAIFRSALCHLADDKHLLECV